MPITAIPDPDSGSATPVFRAKMNEVIAAINAIQTLLTGGAVTQMTWCRYDYTEDEIVGMGSNIDSVELVSNVTRVHFTEPFADANDYCAVAMADTAGGAANTDMQVNQTTDYVDIIFSSDGGGQYTPTEQQVNLIIVYNATL